MTLVRIQDLAGEDVKGLPCDIRSRNADGSLKYPDIHDKPDFPAMTKLIEVTHRKERGVTWLRWTYEKRPNYAFDCGYSGVTLDRAGDWYLLVEEKR